MKVPFKTLFTLAKNLKKFNPERVTRIAQNIKTDSNHVSIRNGVAFVAGLAAGVLTEAAVTSALAPTVIGGLLAPLIATPIAGYVGSKVTQALGESPAQPAPTGRPVRAQALAYT